jgi:hypothetical protein
MVMPARRVEPLHMTSRAASTEAGERKAEDDWRAFMVRPGVRAERIAEDSP